MILSATLTALLLSVPSFAGDGSRGTLPLVPYPRSVEIHRGTFDAEGAEVVCLSLTPKETAAVEGFAENLSAISAKRGRGRIVFDRDTTLADEAYRIVVGRRSVEVFSSSYSGTFYAIRTLQQLLPTGIYAVRRRCRRRVRRDISLLGRSTRL